MQDRQKLPPSKANRDCNDAVNCLQAIGIVSHDSLTECIHLNSCAYCPSEAEKQGLAKRNTLRKSVKETKQQLASLRVHYNALQRLAMKKVPTSIEEHSTTSKRTTTRLKN